MATNHTSLHQIDLPAIIQELKNDIATITNEIRETLQQHLSPTATIANKSSLQT